MKRLRTAVSVILAASVMLSLNGCFKFSGDPMSPSSLEKYAKESGARMFGNARDFSHGYNDTYGDLSRLDDGFCIRVKGEEDVRQALDYTDDISMFYSDTIEEATVFVTGDMRDSRVYECFFVSAVFGSERDAEEYYESAVSVHSEFIPVDYDQISYYSAALAEKIFENDEEMKRLRDEMIEELENLGVDPAIVDEWSDMLGEIDSVDDDLVCESFEEDGITYTLMQGKSGSLTTNTGVYLKDKTVFYVYGFGTEQKDLDKNISPVCDAMKVTPPGGL